MMPVPVMKGSAGGSMQPPIIETQDLLPVQAPMTAQSQEQLIGIIEIQKDSPTFTVRHHHKVGTCLPW